MHKSGADEKQKALKVDAIHEDFGVSSVQINWLRRSPKWIQL